MAYFERYMLDESGNLRKVVINVGVGFCLPFYGETAPPGTLACDGSEISREVYKELFQVLGTKAGAGDGVSTFNLPDFRGRFIRGTGGNAAALGVEQEDAIREITGQVSVRPGAQSTSTILYASGALEIDVDAGDPASSGFSGGGGSPNLDILRFVASNVVPTAEEVRPVNVALLWCIIYE